MKSSDHKLLEEAYMNIINEGLIMDKIKEYVKPLFDKYFATVWEKYGEKSIQAIREISKMKPEDITKAMFPNGLSSAAKQQNESASRNIVDILCEETPSDPFPVMMGMGGLASSILHALGALALQGLNSGGFLADIATKVFNNNTNAMLIAAIGGLVMAACNLFLAHHSDKK